MTRLVRGAPSLAELLATDPESCRRSGGLLASDHMLRGPLYFIVSGGGAYTSATHRIPKVDLDGATEDDFVCYPRRGDSLSFYSGLYDRRISSGRGWLELAPDEAAAYMAGRLGIEPTRPGDRTTYVSRRVRRVAEWIFPLPGSGRGSLHHFFSEFFDWNEPPLFKNFLRIDASDEEMRIR